MATTTFSLKLLVDKKANKVLFAEAGKEAVDFLFGCLSLPIGSVIKLLSKSGMVGCLGNLYGSVENLNETYAFSKQNKDFLLNPESVLPVDNLSLLKPKLAPTDRNFYRCGRILYDSDDEPPICVAKKSGKMYVTDRLGVKCPTCGNQMDTEVQFIDSGTDKVSKKGTSSTVEGGFVKGVVTYMVMDDLVVSPMSTISSITLLNKFNVENLSSLEEKIVKFGLNESLELLKTSLESRNVLSRIFLGNKGT